MEPIFEIENARVWRGETLALRDFSLTLVHDESVAILGPNGAGKSSFLKLLTGEVRPEADPATSCRLFGEDLWSLEELRHRIGVVMPEEVSRFEPYEIARDAVLSSLRGAYGRTREMRFSQAEKDRARISMEQMGVAHLADREFGALSSGERRRILIARALVHQPQVLVLDEPSTALDFAAAIQLTGMLRGWLAAGRDLILVTHHPGEIPPEIERPGFRRWPQTGRHHRGPLEHPLSSRADGELVGRLVRPEASLTDIPDLTHLTVEEIDGRSHRAAGK